MYFRFPLVKETESHIVILLLRFRLWFLLLGLGLSSSWGGSGSNSGKLRRVSQVLLHGLCLLEGDVSLGSDSQKVLESVGDRVRDTSDGWVSDSEGDAGD